MRRGAWHQCGDRSQLLALEQLQLGSGVGVILSPRDLSRTGALGYAAKYRELGAEVLIDYQFYVPGYLNQKLATYPISSFRAGVSALNQFSAAEMAEFQNQLRIDNGELRTAAVISPAVVYEAGRQDIVQLNARLFAAARTVAGELNIPVYATVALGRSVTASEQTISAALAQATALNSDGWYFAFEFEEERIPSSRDAVRRCCAAGLTLACTGKPVLHTYAGPLGLFSFGFGATGVGLGHSQNLWKFTRDRWQAPIASQGGGGDAPPRFFSDSLWGTIIYPDETARLAASLRQQVITLSQFSAPVSTGGNWNRWDAGKHLVFLLASAISQMSQVNGARACIQAATQRLQNAVQLHQAIQQNGLFLGDATNAYQDNWRLALQDLLQNNAADFDYLELLA
jgi:hypothetical protein